MCIVESTGHTGYPLPVGAMVGEQRRSLNVQLQHVVQEAVPHTKDQVYQVWFFERAIS